MSSIGQWFGRWLGDWLGSGEVDPNAMYGSVTIRLAATGTLTPADNPGYITGATTFAVTATGTLSAASSSVASPSSAPAGGRGHYTPQSAPPEYHAAVRRSRILQEDEELLAFITAFMRVTQ